MTTPISRAIPAIAAGLYIAFGAAACSVDRRVRFESDPPGADITVDGKYLGEAPLELHFSHYGARRVRVSKRGFNTIDSVLTIDAPWYGRFPFDVFSEILFPVWYTDYRSQSYSLTPRPELVGLTEAEMRKHEAEAVARAQALARWVPGDPVPDMPAPPGPDGAAASRPASAPAPQQP